LHRRPSSAERLTAADRPGVAQPVPERALPAQPWSRIFRMTLLLSLAMLAFWEWRMRSLKLAPGDFDDSASAWAEQRRRIDAGEGDVVIVGDSRILFDTHFDRFETLTGIRPIQLALAGTNGRPFLQELASDADFHGLVIVGISELSYFRDDIGLMGAALQRYRFEAPAQRSSFLLHRMLARMFAFLDANYRLGTLVQRLDRGWRSDAHDPYDEVWKIASMGNDRETWLWPRIETDAFLRKHARLAWTHGKVEAVSDAAIRMTLETTAAAVAQIRARGGEVVFVRPPSAFQFRFGEEEYLPRTRGWDALLTTAKVRGVHFEDYPAMQGLNLPEYSHLTRACARVFTDAYVRAVATLTPRLRVLADAPAALSPADCRDSGNNH